MISEDKTMHTTTKVLPGEVHERTASWAERLAQHRLHTREDAPAGAVRADEWVPGAITALWALIDDAVEQANAALEHAGLAERIGARRTSQECWLAMTGPGGEPRHIAVFMSLRPAEGRASGGAHVTTSQTRATIYLVPSVDSGRLRWLVSQTGNEFTARVVDDLLLSVFGDDPAATIRLSRYFSLGESV
jgi:hypothetical protein